MTDKTTEQTRPTSQTTPDEGILTLDEEFLLDWLSKEDSSLYGECRGKALDGLIKRDLVKITSSNRSGTDENYQLVLLTGKGMEMAKWLKTI